MKGQVEVYQITNNKEECIFSSPNMIVDGGKESFLDMLSKDPIPSSIASGAQYGSVSSFNVRAITLGCARADFDTKDSRHALVYTNDSTPQYLDSSADIHHLLPYQTNNDFTGLGASAGEFADLTHVASPDFLDLTKVDLESYGSPEISLEPFYITKTKGQDYVKALFPIHLAQGEKNLIWIDSEGTLPFKVEVIETNLLEDTTTELKEVIVKSSTLEASSTAPDLITVTPSGNAADQVSILSDKVYFLRLVIPDTTDFKMGTVTLNSISIRQQKDLVLANGAFDNFTPNNKNSLFVDSRLKWGTSSVDGCNSLSALVPAYWDIKSHLYYQSNPVEEVQSGSGTYGWASVIDLSEGHGLKFHSSSIDSSANGSVSLIGVCKPKQGSINFFSEKDSPYNSLHLAVDFDCSTVSAVNGSSIAGVDVTLKNLNKETYYVASSHAWSITDTQNRLLSGTVSGTLAHGSMVSLLPKEYATDSFEVTITPHAGSGSGDWGTMILSAVSIGQFSKWDGLSLAPNKAIKIERSFSGTLGSSILISTSATPGAPVYDTDYASGTTYVSQTVQDLGERKTYQISIEPKTFSGVQGTVGLGVLHKSYDGNVDSNLFDHAKLARFGDKKNIGLGYHLFLNPVGSLSGTQFFGSEAPDCVKLECAGKVLQADSSDSYFGRGTYLSGNNLSVDLENGNHTLSFDLRHVSKDSASNKENLIHAPVFLSLKATSPTSEVFLYDWESSKWEKEKSKKFKIQNRHKKQVLSGGFTGPDYKILDGYVRTASPWEIAVGEDSQGWTTPIIPFNMSDEEFGPTFPVETSAVFGTKEYAFENTRNVEILLYKQEDTISEELTASLEVDPEYDSAGTIYLKDFKLVGPPPTREKHNTYFYYGGSGTWQPVSGESAFGIPPSSTYWNSVATTANLYQSITSDGDRHNISLYNLSSMATPSSLGLNTANLTDEEISGVHFGGSRESLYSVIVFHTSGVGLQLNHIGICDASLIAYDKPTKDLAPEQLSSEVSSGILTPRRLGGWTTSFQNNSGSEYTHLPKLNVQSFGDKTFLNVVDGNQVTTFASYADYVSSFNLKPDAAHKFSFDYTGSSYAVSAGIIAEADVLRYWSLATSSWEPYDNHSQFLLSGLTAAAAYNYQAAKVNPYANFLSPYFDVPENWEDVKIMPVISITQTSANGNTGISDLRMYSVYAQATTTSAFPEFPQAQDTSVQSSGLPKSPGEKGHFLNRVEFFGSSYSATDNTSETWERALHQGAYLPASGLTFTSGTFGNVSAGYEGSATLSGTLNKYSVVTSDGYILAHPTASAIVDSSAGLITSGSGGTSVKYILTLTKDEAKYLTYYGGGIETAGLWTIDWDETCKKLSGELNGPPFLNATSGSPYSTSLYNLTNPDTEPVFKLFSKKVFFPGGLKIDDASDHLRIIWTITV